jgi:hypothetical protein
MKTLGFQTWSGIIAALALTLLVSASTAPAATTVTSTSIADAMLLPNITTNTNRGLQPAMYVGDAGTGGGDTRSVLQFSLANIPAGQVILSATLKLKIEGFGNNTPAQITTDGYRLLSSWVEGDGVSGLDSGTSGVTWDRRDKAGTLPNWIVGGASGSGTDRAATSSFTLTGADQSGLVVSKDVTSDVQAWYSGAASNFGWLLQAQSFASGQYTQYATKEEPTVGDRPVLTVTFEPIPEASSALLLGGLFLLRRRRKS